MASDYVDMIHLAHFRFQSEVVVTTAINMQVQQKASDYMVVMKDSDPCISTVVLLSYSCVGITCFVQK